ncbi:hypothetical protein C0J52_06764 [Blattella germanica]|nr:hypothetical protein C0J52_06764 [Blattella germanica]
MAFQEETAHSRVPLQHSGKFCRGLREKKQNPGGKPEAGTWERQFRGHTLRLNVHTGRNLWISVEIMNRIFSPWLYPDFIYYLTPSGRRFKNYCNVLHTFTKKVIRDRAKFYAQKKKNRDEKLSEDKSLGIKRRVAFLDLLLEASLEGANLSEEDIREEVDTFMFEEIAYKEQESIFGDSDREPTMKDLNEMKYLERVIKETLRMYPSVPMLGRNNTEDVTFRGDIVIPKGVLIGSSFYYLHRDEEFFPDPDTFDPDRFLPENSVNRHPFAYVPFSAGPRNCIGQRFAMMEMKMILAHVHNKRWHKSLRCLNASFRFQRTDTVHRRAGQGRPWATTARDDHYLLLTARRSRQQNATQLRNALQTATGLNSNCP